MEIRSIDVRQFLLRCFVDVYKVCDEEQYGPGLARLLSRINVTYEKWFKLRLPAADQ